MHAVHVSGACRHTGMVLRALRSLRVTSDAGVQHIKMLYSTVIFVWCIVPNNAYVRDT